MIRQFISALLLFTAAASAHAQSCATGDNVVLDPPVFQWAAGNGFETGTLVMDKATDMVINGETLTTRVYAQEGGPLSIPGPTLIMKPGHKYVMSFKNLLPFTEMTHEHNTFTDPDVTNVHTHGLHISGESPGDDVTRAFEGQRGGDYVYDIPADHMGGTFWYHAHHHGSTYLQVSSGAFGLIIIDDSNDGIPAEVAAMDERHLLLGYLEPGNAAGTGGDSLISGSFSAGWTINGTVNGDICMPANTWQHWRMLVADQDARLVDLEIGQGCEVELLARDGVWRTTAPRALTDGTLTLTGASRADLAVRCNSDSTVSIGGVQVANVKVDGALPTNPDASPYDSASPDGTWSAQNRPAYLRDLRDEMLNIETQNIRMGARSILGRKFDVNEANLIKDAGSIQEWSLNGATNHPFHLHIYHVQVQSDCGPFEGGEYYDVIAGNCDLRFDMGLLAEAYSGRTIFHCHILEHEDQGAMAWMQVNGATLGPPILPEGYSEYYPLTGEPPPPPSGPTAPSNLAASAVSSSQIDLSWSDNSGDEDYFNLESSTDGSNFTLLATLGANQTSTSDTGLAASTTYYYRVLAGNGDGESAYSNVASATTLTAGGDPSAVDVASVVVSTVNAGKGNKQGRAVVSIVDDLGNPVSGALVDGSFTGDINEDVFTAQTGADGTVTVTTTGTAKPLNNLTFCVSYVGADNLQDYSGNFCSSL